MLMSTDCATCGKTDVFGVFSERLRPRGWFTIEWTSEHSHHLEVVCSLDCVRAFSPPEDERSKGDTSEWYRTLPKPPCEHRWGKPEWAGSFIGRKTCLDCGEHSESPLRTAY